MQIHPEPSVVIRSSSVHENLPHRPPSDCCIFRVQNHLRKVKEEAYEPNIIAIGPYHSPFHNDKHNHLLLMEEHKECYLRELLEDKKHVREKFSDAIKEIEEEVLKCYAEPLIYKENTLVDMMVLDACFIIQLVRKYNDPKLRKKDDPIFRIEWIINSLQRDLLLFENQIPFFVICKLFDMTKDPNSNETFTLLARKFFQDIFPGDAHHDADNSDTSNRFRHLLGLVHKSWLPRFTPPTKKEEEKCEKGKSKIGLAKRLENFKHIHCVSDLKAAGIKFKKGKGNVFNITFENGTMLIPPFIIEDRTESFFRNLIAHEQYRQGTEEHFVTDYIRFMDCLINSSKDVGSLRRRNIIYNWLGDDEVVSSMFNMMTKSVVASGELFHYNLVFDRVNRYYYTRWHRSMATLRRQHLNSPWAFVSVFAAFVLLGLTLLQTVFTVKP